MGDAGEGLVDIESRIQERMEELQAERANIKKSRVNNPEQIRKIESLMLARTQMSNQLQSTANQTRRAQIQRALADIDNQIAAMRSVIDRQ